MIVGRGKTFCGEHANVVCITDQRWGESHIHLTLIDASRGAQLHNLTVSETCSGLSYHFAEFKYIKYVNPLI